MSVKLRIPPEALPDLVVIRDLEKPKLKKAMEAVRALGLVAQRSQLRDVLNEHLGSIAGPIVCAQALALQPRSGMSNQPSPSELLDAMTEEVGRGNTPGAWTPAEVAKWKAVLPTLKDLFAIPSLRVCAKGLDLAYEHARVLTAVRVLTDLRPVFDESATSVPAAVVTHQLRLTHTHDRGRHEVFFALDRADLERLRDVCERALKKERTLQETCAVQKITVLDYLDGVQHGA